MPVPFGKSLSKRIILGKAKELAVSSLGAVAQRKQSPDGVSSDTKTERRAESQSQAEAAVEVQFHSVSLRFVQPVTIGAWNFRAKIPLTVPPSTSQHILMPIWGLISRKSLPLEESIGAKRFLNQRSKFSALTAVKLRRNNYLSGVVISVPSSLSGKATDYVTADIDFSTSDTLIERLTGSWISTAWGRSFGIKWFGTQMPLDEEEAKNFIKTTLLLGKGVLVLPVNRRYLQPGWNKRHEVCVPLAFEWDILTLLLWLIVGDKDYKRPYVCPLYSWHCFALTLMMTFRVLG